CSSCYEELLLDTYQCKIFLDNFIPQNKKIISCVELNFLCNSYMNKEKILSLYQKYPQAETFCIISCGIGIQFVSDIVEKEIVALTDSIQPLYNPTAATIQHGISLNNYNFCATCGQCFLNYTENICPIVNCSKSLLNGPCGGAKNGKCEVDKTKDCGWEKIYKKLKNVKKSRLVYEVIFRNYNIATPLHLKELIDNNLNIRIFDFYGGIHPEHKEHTDNYSIVEFPASQLLYLFLSQHIGKPSISIVKKNQYIK
ncbi:MAG: methylenetetrahydrofolate reductase C-terminal domain-containing protein, partial [Elusimicrobiota bacterium]|nr:methylenetetrahydrofolate reductase C-terminal domain-containing protein [Endomicrobiia bacterium]MDW8166837.1 methylenetetrahydrofolate reductase C-terminal domain-containing protein [Elusimicrobiota bacterium]